MKERRRFRTSVHLMVALGVLGLAGGMALAQGGEAIEWWVLGGGGGSSSDGGSVALYDTLGQPLVGPSSGGGDVALGTGYWYGWPIPTAVELAWFTATPREGVIALAWETASEIDLLGFHVYRAEAVDGPRTRLTGDLLPGQAPGSPVGAVYEFVDEAVAPGVTYWYWLADVDTHGAATLHGPVSAGAPGGGSYRVYLPVVSK
jgi:hypothetical protein